MKKKSISQMKEKLLLMNLTNTIPFLKITCVLSLCLWAMISPLFAQSFAVKSKTKGGEVFFYAQNANYCPYQVNIQLKNPELAKKTSKFNHYAIIPAQSDSVFLFSLTLNTPDSVLKYAYQYTLGDPESTKPEIDYPYLLPYMHQSRYFLLQGYDGKFSHKKQYALDFKMKEGSAICAARSGVVVSLKKDSNKGGKSSEYSKDANYIIIYHNDGTFAHYFHLQQNGVTVSVGDRVNAGQIIGISGNTGWSTTPHLHFVVKKPLYQDLVSIPTKFITRPKKTKILCKWRKYKAFHPK